MKCKTGFKEKKGKCMRVKITRKKAKNKNNTVWKKNWDVFNIYISIALGFLISYVGAATCTDTGFLACLGWILPFFIGLGASAIFLIISVYRTIRNKKLNRNRWYFMIVPVIAIIILFRVAA